MPSQSILPEREGTIVYRPDHDIHFRVLAKACGLALGSQLSKSKLMVVMFAVSYEHGGLVDPDSLSVDAIYLGWGQTNVDPGRYVSKYPDQLWSFVSHI